jgi:hypothetical protein
MKSLSLLYFIFVLVEAAGLRKYMKNQAGDFDSTNIFQKYILGSMGNYLSPSEFKKLMSGIVMDFPEIVKKVKVGKTYLGVDIPGFVLASGLNSTNWNKQVLERPAILINGMHHARELTTQSMCVYTYLKLLFKYVKNDPETIYMLQTTAIFIIPIVNFDGYR